MSGFVGKWEYVSEENIDDYITAAGYPENMRDAVKQSKPTVDISQNGDQWTIKSIVGNNVKEVTFKIGEEIDAKTILCKDMKATVTMESDKMVEIQKIGSDEIKIVREISGDILTTSMTTKSVTCVCKSKRV